MAWFYGLLGALVITGLISRLLDKHRFKETIGARKAALVAATTLAITVTIGSLTESFMWAVSLYGPAVAFWLVADLVRARKPESTSSAT